MLRKLRLERFKNFEQAELVLGPLTLLVGTNGSGKSNLRDAFRFLHGISRGYTLAEILGGKSSEGVTQWRGLRGGSREIAYKQSPTFVLDVELDLEVGAKARYRIEVEIGKKAGTPQVVQESLSVGDKIQFKSLPAENRSKKAKPHHITVQVLPDTEWNDEWTFYSNRPVLSQIQSAAPFGVSYFPHVSAIVDWKNIDARKLEAASRAKEVMICLNSVRFLDLNPDIMREPSFPDQPLGDRGENLSSVLQAICNQPQQKEALIEWIEELTPMDCKDFEFPEDQIGRVLLTLIEENGQKTSAYSASDGTLRFLGVIATLLATDPDYETLDLEDHRCYFIEELENGIHPTRLALLLQLIEQKVSGGKIQMIASTHSPHLLGLLCPKSLDNASLIYRLRDCPAGRIKRILEIPDARRLVEKQGIARLQASGWFEDVVDFLENMEARS